MPDPPTRPLPTITEEDRPFWTGGIDGRLHIQRCSVCGLYIHPPTAICRGCLSQALVFEAVSGFGTVITYTVNHQQWYESMDPPYVIAIVELDEQPELQFLTNIVNCDPASVFIGMRVRVLFEQHGEVALPVFEPIEEEVLPE